MPGTVLGITVSEANTMPALMTLADEARRPVLIEQSHHDMYRLGTREAL